MLPCFCLLKSRVELVALQPTKATPLPCVATAGQALLHVRRAICSDEAQPPGLTATAALRHDALVARCQPFCSVCTRHARLLRGPGRRWLIIRVGAYRARGLVPAAAPIARKALVTLAPLLQAFSTTDCSVRARRRHDRRLTAVIGLWAWAAHVTTPIGLVGTGRAPAGTFRPHLIFGFRRANEAGRADVRIFELDGSVDWHQVNILVDEPVEVLPPATLVFGDIGAHICPPVEFYRPFAREGAFVAASPRVQFAHAQGC